ncbi:MAG: glycerophosphodiester phosphodiesterase family protein [Pseudomonadota bacterium]
MRLHMHSYCAQPIAHRGLHGAVTGHVENSTAALREAYEAGYAIECDVRASVDHQAFVFHDATGARLLAAPADARSEAFTLAAQPADAIQATRVAGTDAPPPTFEALLALVAGRVPLIVEIKPDAATRASETLDAMALAAATYTGDLAFKSFDPDLCARLKRRLPYLPIGLVIGPHPPPAGVWPWRCPALRDLTSADFLSVAVSRVHDPLFQTLRRLQAKPLFTWTVREPEEHSLARRYADAAIFELTA